MAARAKRAALASPPAQRHATALQTASTYVEDTGEGYGPCVTYRYPDGSTLTDDGRGLISHDAPGWEPGCDSGFGVQS